MNLQNYSADPLQRILIAYNTIINSAKTSLGGSGAYPPADVTFANNIFHNPSEDVFSDPTGNVNWMGNIFNGDLGISPSEGLSDINPELVLNNEGFYQLAQTSPAIDVSQQGFPPISAISDLDIDHDIMLDIMKQTRPADITLKDVGCNEFSDQVIIQPHATEYNTGPTYLQDQNFVILYMSAEGEGTIAADPPSGVYDAGQEVTLTASPGPFEVFKEWSGDISGTSNPVTITMDQNKEVTAVFETLSINTIQIYIEGEGRVLADPPGWSYLDNTPVTLTAEPDSGYVFDQWTGNLFSSDNPLELIINSDMILFANFKSLPVNADEFADTYLTHNTQTVKIFPNPVCKFIQFILPDKHSGVGDVMIFDASGDCVFVKSVDKLIMSQEKVFMMDISPLSPGLFTVQFQLKRGNDTRIDYYSRKFVKL